MTVRTAVPIQVDHHMSSIAINSPGADARGALGAERVARPIACWAWVGLGCVAISTGIAFHWVFLSGNFLRQVTVGRSEVPPAMMVGVRLIEAVVLVGTVALAYVCVVRPWRRDRQLSGDALLFLAAYGVTWQDPLYSYTGHFFTYNSAFVNIGSWAGSIPGFMAPHPERIVYPLAIALGYGAYIMSFILLGGCVMRLARRLRPRLGKLGQMVACFVAMMVIGFVFETTVMWLGWYTLSGAQGRLTAFSGHYYQYPLYEALTTSTYLTLFSAIRHFKDDNGYTYVERGLERLRVQGWRRTGVRLLATVGALNVIWFCALTVPVNYLRLHQSPWPQDIVDRPYFNTGLCQPDLHYACEGWESGS